ncbi:E3 ubiquitin-protein ligase ATL59 [Apostasia shenzhenica]|uniref:RING-type E3 ubiquitin transferase n=1 Tax=Apostasia shenzhenica TaxID=1088818 RepID=A0A2I0B5T8_9ASPA|nr:E3 ubiquitin-protein ligase ATL59 [Apostasia shenzhenica]
MHNNGIPSLPSSIQSLLYLQQLPPHHRGLRHRHAHPVEGPKTPETLIPVCRFREDESTFSTECSVCLSAFRKGEKVRQLPACKHSFHAPCIDMWLRSQTSCPCCRAPVPQIAAAIEGERLQRGEEEEAAAAAAEAVVVEEEEENREVIVSVESA